MTTTTKIETPLALAKRVAARVRELTGESVGSRNGPFICNKKQTKEQGWLNDACATVAYEGDVGKYDNLGHMIMCEADTFTTPDYYIDLYAGWLAGVYPRH